MRNALLFVLMLCGASLCFGAEVYPNQPVRLIVPFGPGGSSDVFGRVISQPLAEQLGKQFIIDNRPGAGGRIGTAVVAKAAPTGYVLLVTDAGLTIYPGLYKSLPFDVLNDFTPITQILRMPNVLVVHPSLNVKTLKEFIALAQANPGKLNYGSGGSGSTPHLFAELFKMVAKVNLVHIPYKGGAGEMIVGLLGGQVEMLMPPMPTVLPHVTNGKLRALAVTTDGKRSSLMPDVPSMGEAGVSGMTVYTWNGLVGPAGLPREVINTLRAEVIKALAVPSVRERFMSQGAELIGSRPEEFSAHIRNELRRWTEVIRLVGIAPE